MNSEVSRNGNDMNGSVKRGKGWRSTPLLQPSPQTIAPQDKQSRKGRRRQREEVDAMGDTTDIQEMGDFDFEGELKKFDKKQVTKRMRRGLANTEGRYCIECGVTAQHYTPGKKIDIGHRDVVVCWQCGRFGEVGSGSEDTNIRCYRCAPIDPAYGPFVDTVQDAWDHQKTVAGRCGNCYGRLEPCLSCKKRDKTG